MHVGPPFVFQVLGHTFCSSGLRTPWLSCLFLSKEEKGALEGKKVGWENEERQRPWYEDDLPCV